MLRLLTDENFDENILRGLRGRLAEQNFLSVRDARLAGQPDSFLLKWALQENRTILTHDLRTMTKDAEELVARGEPMAGLIFVPNKMPIGRAINDLELVLACYSQSDMRDRVEYLPLSSTPKQV
jgi:hypothetical protein